MARGKTAETKKKPARVAAGPEASGFARSLGESVGLVIQPLIPLVIFAAVLAGVSFLLWRSVGYVSAANRDIAPGTSDLINENALRQAILKKPRPQWVPREDFESAAGLGLFARNHSVFEPNLSHSLAEKFEASPWIERVQSLRLHYPAQVDMEVEWRRPAARVNKVMVLDRNGFVLNLMPDNNVIRDVPLITGVVCSRVDAGSKVREKELMDALGLLAVVRDTLQCSPGHLKIASLMREPSGNWRIVTDRGPAVYWGAFTDDPPMDEPRTREKADLLRRRLCEIKDPWLLEYVKVYHAQAPVRLRGTQVADTPANPPANAPQPPQPGPQRVAGSGRGHR